MSAELQNLYSEILIEHSQSPSNFKKLNILTNKASGKNPLCGDAVDVFLLIEDGQIREISFQGQGCAICIASSSMMTECVKGLTLKEASDLFESFREYMLGKKDELGIDLESFEVMQGVRNFPTRIKCATLPWHVLYSALNQGDDVAVNCN